MSSGNAIRAKVAKRETWVFAASFQRQSQQALPKRNKAIVVFTCFRGEERKVA